MGQKINRQKRKKNNQLKFFSFLKEKFKEEERGKQFIGLLIIIFSLFILVSFLSQKGIWALNIKKNLSVIFGWSKFFLPFVLIFWSYFFLKKKNFFDISRIFLGILLIFLTLNLFFHLLFREGGKLGDLLLSLSNYLGNYSLGTLAIIFFFLGCWLIWQERFFNFLKLIYQSSQEKLEQINEKIFKENIKITEPVKQVRKEIQQNNHKLPENQPLKVKKILKRSGWQLPPLNLLIQAKEEVLAPDIKSTSNIIKATLENFGIKVEVVDVEVGPAITRFALKPGEGIKLSKILSYQSDLSLALGTPNLIIETPIPGKAVFGLQVPNKKTANVRLGNVLAEKEFLESDSLLLFPVGRKINGEVFFADFTKMPHLLIAGATGTGKSIFVHNLLVSFLMKNNPETLNLILIDPKRVELINYSDLPHLLLEPIIETKKTLAVFNWLIEEMESRYKLLEESKSRDIEAYNRKQIQNKNKILPRIVLVIDEMADLMVTYGSNIEAMVIRLTQMARATGIHLILATQRPSVDIVTGLIKANIPNRICFKVASYVDSRTVLDAGGAEKLIGEGDGLFIGMAIHRPLRIKTPFISEEEIERVVDFWKKQLEKIPYFEKQTISLEELEKKVIPYDEEATDEELFNEAVQIVIEVGRASTSLLQRRLKIGYARAARILDLMEEKGIVSPQEGSKPRKVLINKEKELFDKEF